MQIILSDYNCEGQALAIFNRLYYDQVWLELVPMRLLRFRQISLSRKAPDERVWRTCQEEGFILLTGNRSGADGDVSLEHIIRTLVTPDSLPVLTIGNLKRVSVDPDYCRACGERMAEIVDDIENFRGTTRLFIP